TRLARSHTSRTPGPLTIRTSSPVSGSDPSLMSTAIRGESGATPDRPSAAEMVATWCQAPLGGHSTQFASGIPAMIGRGLSMFTVRDCGTSSLQTKSFAKKVTVVDPSSAIDRVNVSPVTTPAGSEWAPVKAKCSSRTAPPVLSVAVSVTTTAELFQWVGVGGCVTSATLDGAIVSAGAKTARLLATARPLGLSDEALTIERACVTGCSIASVVDPPPSRLSAL